MDGCRRSRPLDAGGIKIFYISHFIFIIWLKNFRYITYISGILRDDVIKDDIFQIVENEKKSKGRKKAPEIEPVIMRFDWDCGGAAFCDDLLMMKRDDVLKTNLYERLDVNPIDGTKSQNIKKVCEEEGIEYVETTGASINDLEYWLSNEYVCLISYQAWGSEEEMDALESGHYSTVFSIDEEGVWLLDPSIDTEEIPDAGKGVICVTKEELDRRWIDKGVEGEIYDHWLLAMKSPGAQSDKI